jgi:exodeoxyribonuclease VII large subunit
VLVTSVESAAYHDFMAGLAESGWGFRVTVIDAAVQGPAAERSVASALAAAGRLAPDAVVLVRGGGSRSDLAAFDSRRVAEAVARCARPVLTGLGHETDRSIADEAAHTAVKTPTRVAELLNERVATADRSVAEAAARLTRAARRNLEQGRAGLARGHRALGTVRARLATGTAHLREIADRLSREARRRPGRAAEGIAALRGRLGSAAPRGLRRESERRRRVAERLVASTRARLDRLVAVLQGYDRLRVELGPGRVLARGFSITRGEDGRVLRRAGDARSGERLTTRLAEGNLRSRVEES